MPGVASRQVWPSRSPSPLRQRIPSASCQARMMIEGSAKRTAEEIGGQLKVAFQRQGWI
jgi:hypothetical protein